MPKLIGRIIQKRVVIDILVTKLEKPKFDSLGNLLQPGHYVQNNQGWVKALIDTGATNSVISIELVQKLDLRPIGKQKICTASAKEHEVFSFEAGIGIKLIEGVTQIKDQIQEIGSIKWYPIVVTGNDAIKHQGLDAIIGMDIIMSGHLTISEGIFIFSL